MNPSVSLSLVNEIKRRIERRGKRKGKEQERVLEDFMQVRCTWHGRGM
jgi:predicted transposase YdaD